MSSKTRPLLEGGATEKERSQREPRTRFEIEREVVSYSSMNRRLGTALSWAVDTLMEGAGDLPSDPLMTTSTGSTKRREALECVAYVRDVLRMGQVIPVSQLEEDRLLGETEYHRPDSPVVPAFPTRAANGPSLDGTVKPSRQVFTSCQSNRDSTPASSLTRAPLISTPPSTNTFRGASTNTSQLEHSLASLFDRKPKETVGVRASSEVSEVLQRHPSLSSYDSQGPNARNPFIGINAQDSDDAAHLSQKYQSDPLRG